MDVGADQVAGEIVLSGVLLVAAISSLVGAVVFVTKQWVGAKDAQITDLRSRVNLLDTRVEVLTGRIDNGVVEAVDRLNANMMARFQDLEEVVKERERRFAQ